MLRSGSLGIGSVPTVGASRKDGRLTGMADPVPAQTTFTSEPVQSWVTVGDEIPTPADVAGVRGMDDRDAKEIRCRFLLFTPDGW